MSRPHLTPGCCDEVRDHETVYLVVPDDFFEGKLTGQPSWCVETPQYPKLGQVPIKGCPHCLAPVPEVELRAPSATEGKVCKCSDGGYYCETCGLRGQECRCLPPAFHWKVKGTEDSDLPPLPPPDE